MNGKRRDAEQRLVDLDEFGVEVAILVCDDDATGEPQVTVEPRVPDTTAVKLDSYLKVAQFRLLRHGPDLTFRMKAISRR